MVWCEEIYEPTEWDEFFDFSRWLENIANMSWDRGEEEQLREAFESWLDAELDAILDNAKDLDEADSWATEVRRVTHEYFGMSDFDTRFSRFDTDADEKFGEPDPPIFETYQRDRASDAIEFSQASSPSARALERLKASASASDQEANKIRALFEQLS